MSASVGIDCRREFEMLRLKVTSMTCNNCIQSVIDAVQSVAPSARIDVRPEDGEVAGASDLEQVIAGSADAGYSVQRLAA
jgi:copper chaperone CopZ